MELSSSNIKKFIIFPEIELSSLIFFLYFREKFSKFKKLKKQTLKKNFLYFGKWNFLAPSLKNSYISEGSLKVPSLFFKSL